MEIHSVQNINRPKSSVPIHFVFLFLWVITGALGFTTLGHKNFVFPILIFVWLFIGIGWFTAFRWKWKAILLAPILTVLIGSGLSTLYISYDERLAKQALDQFMVMIANGKVLSEFSVSNEIWDEMQTDVSQNYAIEYSDNFFGAHEWIVRFTNGSAYFLSFQQTRLGYWSVSIEHSK